MITPDVNMLLPLTTAQSTSSNLSARGASDEALKDVARDFEAAFIAQMLTHTGLAESMTSGEGKMAEAFGSFYIEQLADRMADAGGIGMADSIYNKLTQYAEQGGSS